MILFLTAVQRGQLICFICLLGDASSSTTNYLDTALIIRAEVSHVSHFFQPQHYLDEGCVFGHFVHSKNAVTSTFSCSFPLTKKGGVYGVRNQDEALFELLFCSHF